MRRSTSSAAVASETRSPTDSGTEEPARPGFAASAATVTPAAIDAEPSARDHVAIEPGPGHEQAHQAADLLHADLRLAGRALDAELVADDRAGIVAGHAHQAAEPLVLVRTKRSMPSRLPEIVAASRLVHVEAGRAHQAQGQSQ
jgi:hypothetical protein